MLQEDEPGDLRLKEKLLQLIWHYQRLLREQLQTTDGRPLRILHPGFWNQEAGPDFRDAVIQFPPGEPLTGDVEIDMAGSGWKSHAHDINPLYSKVILHVVWEGSAGNAPLPTLALKPFLDAPWQELQLCLSQDTLESPESLLGNCSAPLRKLPEPALRELFRQAAAIRLQSKASQIQARARQAGWEQALWEGLFGALGYKNNIWPMRLLAELLPKIGADLSGKESVPLLQARLLGMSGLLPPELTRSRATVDRHLRDIWDLWWRERDTFSELVLPRAIWRFHNLRPANHPQRRLALAAWWLCRGDLIQRLEDWFAREVIRQDLLSSLLKILQVEQDRFWSWHWTFKSKKMTRPQPMLGSQRATDLAVNVILPWLWARAVAGKDEAVRQRAEDRFFAWPRSEDNVLLRQSRLRLFGSNHDPLASTAANQQALLQILRDFCEHSNALCERCQFPEMVRKFPG
jgi:hypothetical protein